MRDTIFISHATPADNDFSIWIASRLEMLGYKVWIDKEGLLGGERFWATIQKALDRSIKVLFVYSKNIVTTEGILRQGIENELEYAKSIAAQDGLLSHSYSGARRVPMCRWCPNWHLHLLETPQSRTWRFPRRTMRQSQSRRCSEWL